jgi:hypothetical protein
VNQYTPVTLTASMLSDAGMGAFSAANAVDGNLSDVAWNTNTATGGGGSYVQLDLGIYKQLEQLNFCMSAAGSTSSYGLFYYDDTTTNWIEILHGYVPSLSGCNPVTWSPIGARRYFRFQLNNTPGTGPTVNELQVFIFNQTPTFTSTVSLTGTASCSGCQGNPQHIGYVANNISNDHNPSVVSPAVSYPSYINVSNTDSGILNLNGSGTNDPVQGDVNCSVGGLIFASIFSNMVVEAAFSQTQDQAQPPIAGPDQFGRFTYLQTIWCSDASSPSDWRPTQVKSVIRASYYLGMTFCGSFTGGADSFFCLSNLMDGVPYTKYDGSVAVPWANPAKYDCTNYSRNIDGYPLHVPFPF